MKDYPNSKEILRLFSLNNGILKRNMSVSRNTNIGDIVGSKVKSGYLVVKINNKQYYVHRLIWIMINGDIPDDMQIDHTNHQRDDNRIENLRLVSHIENARNRSISKNNSSGYNGICLKKNRYEAFIIINKKNVYLGRFENKQDAINARDNANIEFGFHEKHGVANVQDNNTER